MLLVGWSLLARAWTHTCHISSTRATAKLFHDPRGPWPSVVVPKLPNPARQHETPAFLVSVAEAVMTKEKDASAVITAPPPSFRVAPAPPTARCASPGSGCISLQL